MQSHAHTTTSITTVNIQATGPALSTHGGQITATSLQEEAYISTFNAMEAKLRALYVEPLLSDKEFRRGITLRQRLTLQEQSRKLQALIEVETAPATRRNLYWQLRQVNDTPGVPTESAVQLLGADAPLLPVAEGPVGTA